MTLPPAPAVTVVIPTHDRPEQMARAVRSVVDQTYDGHIDIVVVFDACEVILPEVELPPNRSLRGMPNDRARGLAGARNSGILAASAALVAFLDDDDHWLPSKLEEQVAALAQHPDAVLIGTAMVVDDGRRTHDRLLPAEVITHEMLLHDRLAGLHSSSFLVRREALLGRLGLIDEDLPRSYAEDYDLLLRAAELGPVPVVNRPLVTVTWQGRSLFLGRWMTYAAALERVLDKHAAFADHPRALGRIEAQIAFALGAAGARRPATRWLGRALRHSPAQPKAWLAMAVVLRLTSPERVARTLRRFGRGL